MFFGATSFAASPFGSPGGVSINFVVTGSEINVASEGEGILFSAFNDAQLSTAQKKFGTASLLLDGTNDYVESTSNIDLSSTNFTVDLWIRPTSVSGYKGIWTSGTSSKLTSYLLGNTVYWSVGGSTIISNSVQVNANEWTMLSYERIGLNHYIYKNGTLEDTGFTGNKPDNGPFNVGENFLGDFNGYIDEVRVSNIARYTGTSFTQPTNPFVPDTSALVLLHFDGANGSTTITNSAFSGTTVIGKARILPGGSEIEVTIGNVVVRLPATVLVTGVELDLATGESFVVSWNPIAPGATQIWTPIDPDNP